MYLSQNLKYLRRKNNRQTQEELAESLQLTRSVISAYEDGRAEPNITTLIRISSYFNVSIEHLTNFDLAKMDDKEIEQQKMLVPYVSAQNLKVNTVQSEDDNQFYINLVPQKASAGYTGGYGDADYLKELPAYKLPFLSKGKVYRAFEITGDSMLPLKDKSIVIGEWLESWEDAKDGQVCIVVSKNEGIVLKKVYKKVAERESLLLKSSNILYAPYEIPISEVLEIWKFTAYISNEFPMEYDSADDLRQAFARMEYELMDLKMNQTHLSR